MKMLARLVLALALLLAVVAQSRPAFAQGGGGKEEAEARFKRAVELYEEENFAAALVEFRRAYEIVPAFPVLYNVARTCYQLRDYACALKTFERYLVEGAGQIDAARKEEVEREMAIIRRRIVTVNVTATKGSTITVDNVPVGEAPLPKPLQVTEGRRLLRATMPGHPSVEKSIEAAGGDTISVDLTLPDKPAETTTPTPAPAEAKQGGSTPWWLWGTAGVLAVGAGITGGLALGASGDASDIRSNGGALADYESAEDRMRAFSIATDVLAVTAVVAGVTALVLTLSSSEAGPSTPAAKGKNRLRFAF